MEYKECRERAREFVSVIGFKIYFFHINDLRESKILARLPKDLNDILLIDDLLKRLSDNADNL
jgi:hypothetical protein